MSKLYKTDAIVLKQIKYGESSLIVKMFTKEKGLRSFMVGSVRGKRSRAAMFQIMNQLDVLAYESGPDKLNRIKEFRLKTIYRSIGSDMIKNAVGIFMIDLFLQSVKEQETNLELYDFMTEQLDHLDSTEHQYGMMPLTFTLNLSKHLGFFPQNNYSAIDDRFSILDGAFTQNNQKQENKYLLSPELSQCLSGLLSQIDNDQEMTTLPKRLRTDLLNKLINFYKVQLEGFKGLKSIEVIQTLFG